MGGRRRVRRRRASRGAKLAGSRSPPGLTARAEPTRIDHGMVLCSKRCRGVVAVAVAAAALAVVACGSGTQGDSERRQGDGHVTLTLRHIADNRPALTRLIADYRKVAPNVTIQRDLRGRGSPADVAARPDRRRQRAGPVRRLARQRVGDGGPAARPGGRRSPTSPSERVDRPIAAETASAAGQRAAGPTCGPQA